MSEIILVGCKTQIDKSCHAAKFETTLLANVQRELILSSFESGYKLRSKT